MRKKQKPTAKRRKRQISADSYLKSDEMKLINEQLQQQPKTDIEATKRMVVLMFLQTGLRSEELADLEMKDLPHRRKKTSLRVRHGKGNVERLVDVSEDFIKEIAEYCRIYRPKARDTSPVFRSQRGGMLSYGAIFHKVRSFGEAAGVTRLRPHILRHTYATYLYKETADLRYVQCQLGHANASTTEIYTGIITVDRNTQLSGLYENL